MRHQTPSIFVLAALGGALAGCGGAVETSGAEGSDAVTIVYSSRLDGEIEPCG